MKLTVNSKETEVKDGCTIAELSTFLALPEKGIAIAVNNRMVPRIEWEKCVLPSTCSFNDYQTVIGV